MGPGDISSAALQFNENFIDKAAQHVGGNHHAGFFEGLSIDRRLQEHENQYEEEDGGDNPGESGERGEAGASGPDLDVGIEHESRQHLFSARNTKHGITQEHAPG